jgi:Tfp pilus assembly protein FimT
MVRRITRSLLRGYNWIDFAFLIGLALVSTSLAVPSMYDTYRVYGLVSTAEELAITLELAKSLAVSQGAPYEVQFNARERSFQVVNVSESQPTVAGENRLGAKVSLKSASGYPIAFSASGATKGGSAWLSTSHGHTVEVKVDLSGRVIVKTLEETAS